MKIHLYKAKDGVRWRMTARNGRIMADSGEAYTRPGDAAKAARKVVRAIADISEIEILGIDGDRICLV